MLLVRSVEPLPEVSMAVATRPAVAEKSADWPTGVELALLDSDLGACLRLTLTLFDRPTNPLVIDTLINPVPDGGRDLLEDLQRQSTLQILFYHQKSGEALRRRVIRLDRQFQASLAEMLALTEGGTTTPERWDRLVARINQGLE